MESIKVVVSIALLSSVLYAFNFMDRWYWVAWVAVAVAFALALSWVWSMFALAKATLSIRPTSGIAADHSPRGEAIWRKGGSICRTDIIDPIHAKGTHDQWTALCTPGRSTTQVTFSEGVRGVTSLRGFGYGAQLIEHGNHELAAFREGVDTGKSKDCLRAFSASYGIMDVAEVGGKVLVRSGATVAATVASMMTDKYENLAASSIGEAPDNVSATVREQLEDLRERANKGLTRIVASWATWTVLAFASLLLAAALTSGLPYSSKYKIEDAFPSGITLQTFGIR